MSAFADWAPYENLPTVLEAILQETEINNSFTDDDTTAQLQDSLESSYAYLYRLQSDTAEFSQYHYQTRKFLLETDTNDIEIGTRRLTKELEELEQSETPDTERIKQVKKELAKYMEILYGDLYLNDQLRICVFVPHHMVPVRSREAFRRSTLYGKFMTISEVMHNRKMFETIPVCIINDRVRTDVMIRPRENGTEIMFTTLGASDLYSVVGTQKPNDVEIIFIAPTVYETTEIESAEFENRNVSSISMIIERVEREARVNAGILFLAFHFNKESSHLIEAHLENGSIVFSGDARLENIYNANKAEKILMTCMWFKNLHKYEYSHDEFGRLPTRFTMDNSGNIAEKILQSPFFIPFTKEGTPYPMPIPESNFLVMRTVNRAETFPSEEDSDVLITNYTDEVLFTHPEYKCGVNLHYPNIYQVTDENPNEVFHYTIYYAYRDEEKTSYTPLFKYYWDYMIRHYRNRYNLEDLINLLHFKDEFYDWDRDGTATMEEAFNDLYDLFLMMMSYKDYKYNYDTPDFICQYSTDVGVRYKISRMMEFIQADWTVLPDYVRKERRKETLYHFFTNTINLSKRLRRSTRLEAKDGGVQSFAAGCVRCSSTTKGALRVTDNKSYDRTYEVYIDDVKPIISDISVNEYVSFIGMVERYVFAFKNTDSYNKLPIKIFVDGLLSMDTIIVHSLGMDYLYIPTSIVSDDSYIMIEREYALVSPVITEFRVNNRNQWNEVNLIESDGVLYTMQDIILKYNGNTLPKDNYEIRLVRNHVKYTMNDPRKNVTNKFGIVNQVAVKITAGIPFPADITLQIQKPSLSVGGECIRNGYPRLNLSALELLPQAERVRFYSKGRLVPTETFRLVETDVNGINYIQFRVFCRKGDWCMAEYSPYAREVVCELDEFDPNAVFDFTRYVDKPIDPCYYEVYVNGRRLGLPNLFAFGPFKGVFRGLKSKYLLTIYEKERDFEYYGYSRLPDIHGKKFFYLPSDLISESFMTKDEAEALIDAWINDVKHPDAIIKPNVLEEDPITITVEEGISEEMKIFYFEELLPLGFANPNELQFIKRYLDQVFPGVSKEYVIDSDKKGAPKLVYLDPNKTARIIDTETGEYEMIDTKDADPEKQYVMLTGEIVGWEE